MQAILASATAPYVSTVAGVLMPVKKIVTAPTWFIDGGAALDEMVLEEMLVHLQTAMDAQTGIPMPLYDSTKAAISGFRTIADAIKVAKPRDSILVFPSRFPAGFA